MSIDLQPQDTSTASARALPRWLWPVLVGLLLIIIGGLAYLWWSQRPPTEGDAAVTFARDMMAHHLQAVEMAVLMRDRSEDVELRQLALDILLTQQAQIGQMQGWLAVWGLPLAGSEPLMSGTIMHGGTAMPMTPEMMGMQPAAEVQKLQTLPVAEAEVHFLRMMIAHHQGGVLMAEAALQNTQRPEVRRLAEAVIEAQTGEISYMQGLLAKRNAAP